MSEKNPKLVVDTIMESSEEKQQEGQVKIFPMTIRRYAILEKLDSPFIDPNVDFQINTIIPTAYVMCTSKDKLREYKSNDIEKLIQDSYDWSEDLEVNDIPDMVKAITKQLNDMNKASPDQAPQKTDTKKN